MAPGREDVDHDLVGEGGAVPDGLHYGDGLPPLRNVSVRNFMHNSDHYMVLG